MTTSFYENCGGDKIFMITSFPNTVVEVKSSRPHSLGTVAEVISSQPPHSLKIVVEVISSQPPHSLKTVVEVIAS